MPSERIRAIARSPLAGALLHLFGHRYRSITLSDAGLTVSAGSSKILTLSELFSATHLTKTLGFTTIVLPVRAGAEIKITGLKRREANVFVKEVNAARQRHFTEQVQSSETELRALAQVINRLDRPKLYPSACLVAPFLNRAKCVFENLPTTIPDGVMPAHQQVIIDTVLSFQKTPDRTREAAVKSFINVELAAQTDFFDTIETNPLTQEQRLAVVIDEDAHSSLQEQAPVKPA